VTVKEKLLPNLRAANYDDTINKSAFGIEKIPLVSLDLSLE
jgi:hypothetical protein